jgi:GNAT superfamily N-acetyltransferase
VQIRALQSNDAAAYHQLRLRALREHPEAFATSYEEELARDAAEVAVRLLPGEEHVTLGAFGSEHLVGIATLVRPLKSKLRHRATIAAMYVLPDARSSGVGGALLEATLEQARAWRVSDVSLSVTVGNLAARKIYVRAGFQSFGIEPRCIRVDGRFYDVEWMNRALR